MRNHSVTYVAEPAWKALADPTRRALLDTLRTSGGQPVGRVAAAFPMSRPAISKHLRVLRRAKLVKERWDGRCCYYELNPIPLRAVDDWLSQYRQMWQTRLTSLKEHVEAEWAREKRSQAAQSRKRAKAGKDRR